MWEIKESPPSARMQVCPRPALSSKKEELSNKKGLRYHVRVQTGRRLSHGNVAVAGCGTMLGDAPATGVMSRLLWFELMSAPSGALALEQNAGPLMFTLRGVVICKFPRPLSLKRA